MAKLNKEQLKKLYDYGGTLSPKDWADAMDSLCPDNDIEPSNYISLSYDELVHRMNTDGIIPKQWYKIPYTTQGSITEVYVQGCTTNTLYENALCTGIPVMDQIGNIITEGLHHCKYTTDNHIINDNVLLNNRGYHFDEIHTSIIPNLKDEIHVDKCYISYDADSGDYIVIWNDNDNTFADKFDGTNFIGVEFSSIRLLFENWTGFVYDIIIGDAFYSYDISHYENIDTDIILSGETNVYFIGDINKHLIGCATYGFVYKSKIVNSDILIATYAWDFEDICITANNYYGIVNTCTGLFVNSTIEYIGNTSNQIYVGEKVINSKLKIVSDDGSNTFDIINCIYDDGIYVDEIPGIESYDYVTQSSYNGLYFANYPDTNLSE